MVSQGITILESTGAKLKKYTIDREERMVVENAIAEFEGQGCKSIEMFGTTPSIKALLGIISAHFGAEFKGVFVNYCPDGHHDISDRSDSEVVISVGATRTMHFKRTTSPPRGTAHFRGGSFKVAMLDGSMIALQGPKFQFAYTHGLPKETTVSEPHWSFTFRRIDSVRMAETKIDTAKRVKLE